ncbi:hypothetical protein FACS189475_07190 [Betaproteobacteria bacterium]|nr:hypothetical protein FACS189475_07190 [Betaproteobacteria bacterium]
MGYNIIGGSGVGAAALTGNHVTIQETNTGNVAGDIQGGLGGDGTISFNTVTIQGSGNVGGYVRGGWAFGNGTVTDNTVYIGKDENDNGTYSGTITGPVYGGWSSSGNVDNNKVFISGGTVSGDIYGGYVNSGTGSAINNTVNISTTGAIYNAIYGGRTGNSGGTTGDLFTGNTLNLAAGNTIASVQNFETVKFDYTGAANIAALDLSNGQSKTVKLEVSQGNEVTFDATANLISGTAGEGLQKTGEGMLILAGAHTYTGGTLISGGLINFDALNNFGGNVTDTNIVLDGGGLQWAANYAGADISSRFDTTSALGPNGGILDTNANEVTLNSAINGSGRLTKTGSGTLALAGTNTYTGGTTVSGGTLSIAASTNIGLVGNGVNEINGGTLKLTGTGVDYTHAWTLTGSGNSIETANPNTISGILSGTDGFTKSGDGILTLSNANTYGGATTISAGTLALSGAGSIADSSGLTLADVNGALFDISGASGTTIKGLNGGGANGGNVWLDTNSLTVQSGNFGGNISGTGGLTKTGSGTLTLTGANTYTGNTSIAAGGTLEVTGTLGSGAGSSNDYDGAIANAGTLIFKQNEAQTLSGGISGAGSLTKDGTETLTLSGTNNIGDITVSAGTLGITGINSGTTTGSIVNVADNAKLALDGGAALNTQTVNFAANSTLALSGTGNSLTSGSGGVNFSNNAKLIADLTGVSSGDTALMVNEFKLDMGGTLLVNALIPTGITDGTFILVDETSNNFNFASRYEGRVNGNLEGYNGPNLRYGGNEYDASDTGKLKLTVAGADTNRIATWTGGAANGLWDETSRNWNLDSAPAAYQDFFKNGDTVVFDDTGAGNGNITVGANLTTGNFTTGGITFNNTAGYDYTFTGNGLGSAGTLTKNGDGEVTFNQANGFSAAILNDGRVNLNHAGALGSGAVTLDNAAILGLADGLTFANPVTLASGGGVLAVENGSASASGVISGAGLTKDGAGTLTLTGNNNYGDTTVKDGTLAGNITANTNLMVESSATYDGTGAARTVKALTGDGDIINGNGLTVQSGAFSGNISGAGNLSKEGTGMLILAGDNSSHSGGTTVKGGTLSISHDDNIGSGTNALNDATLQLSGSSGTIYTKAWTLGGSAIIEQNDASALAILDGVLSGAGGSLTKTGAGTLILTADNSYTGGTIIINGTLQIGDGGDSGSVVGDIVNNDTLVFKRSGTPDYAGNISGSGTLSKEGDGTLTLSGSNNSYLGDTTVNTGTLSLTGSLLNSNVNVENSATFDLSGSASQNVTLTSGATFDFSGSVGQNVTLSGGTMNWRGTIGAGGIGGDLDADNSTLNFYVPNSVTTGDTLLNVGGTASVNNSTVNVGIEGASSPLAKGDQIVLIKAAALTGTPANPDNIATVSPAMMTQGISLIYDFDLSTTGEQLIATLRGSSVTPGTKALSEGFLSGMTLVNQSTDLAAEQGMNALRQEIRRSEGQRPIAFGVLSGGSSRYKTGSHIDVDSLSLLTGLAAEVKQNSGDLTLGGFIVYGEGDYDTHNSFPNAASVKGSGETDYAGAGVLARLDFNGTQSGHAYIDGALQAGSVKTTFHSSDLVAQGIGARYITRSNYYGLHLGSGYVWNLTNNSELEASVKYLYAQREGDKLKLNTGDPIRFKTIESHRLRIGARYSWTADMVNRVKPYVGLAWEHEFDGKAKATAYGSAIDAPKLKGDTGIIELGLTMKPSATKPLTVNFGVQGYAGRREGISGSLKVEYRF